jgi:alpha-ketoglutarate-dependent taurine dioxygenase
MTAQPRFRTLRPRSAAPETSGVSIFTLAGRPFPLVLRPGSDVELGAWAEANRSRVESLLAEHGALLFRGFRVPPETGFPRFAEAVGRGGLAYTQRSTRRKKEREGVYTSTEHPAALTIELHSENAFQYRWPTRITFHSVVVAETGGATPIARTDAVLDAMDPQVRDEFVARGITYVRNFGAGLELSWQEAFQTERRDDVEADCRRDGLTWEWRDGDRLRTEHVLPAVVQHPTLDRPVWFNQAHLFHVTNLDPQIRAAMLEAMDEHDLPRHAYFGDGGTIPDETMAQVRRAYDVSRVRFGWEQDDVMLLDNLRMCHGRDPFRGARKVLVSMSQPSDFHQVPVPGAFDLPVPAESGVGR